MATTLEWFGCSTFRMVTDSVSVMLDAYVERADGAAGPDEPVDPAELTGVDWIVVGHAHFDHLYGAERIMAANPDARLIGSYESVRLMVEAGVPEERMVCVAGGERVRLGADVTVDVFPSQHSCVWSHEEMVQPSEVCLGDLGVTWQEQRERMQHLMEYLTTELSPAAIEHLLSTAPGHSSRGDGGALLFVFETPDGRVLFQDTSGHWSGIVHAIDVDAAILAAAGRANVDGEPIQGSLLDFLRAEVETMSPSRVVLGHHDDWLPGFSVPTEMDPIRELFTSTAAALVELDYCAPVEILPIR